MALSVRRRHADHLGDLEVCIFTRPLISMTTGPVCAHSQRDARTGCANTARRSGSRGVTLPYGNHCLKATVGDPNPISPNSISLGVCCTRKSSSKYSKTYLNRPIMEPTLNGPFREVVSTMYLKMVTIKTMTQFHAQSHYPDTELTNPCPFLFQ